MTISQTIERSKPYITGFVIGLIAAPIIGFSAGWISTTGARTAAVENARVDVLATICSAEAEKSWAAQKLEPAALKGWDNRAKREELVASTLTGILVPEPLVKKVSAGCSETLGRA
jgi:hypothetical protein